MSKILVVEDDAALRNLLETVLSKSGFPTLTAENGIKAVDILSTEDISLVITDIMMPGMGGLKLISYIASKNAHIKIITLSGAVHHNLRDTGGDELILEGVESAPNVVKHIKKPFKIEDILLTVKSVLN